jgi:type III restriction enzyme
MNNNPQTYFLKAYQSKAVDELVTRSMAILNGPETARADERTVVLKAPTGSGKTFIMSRYIQKLIERVNIRRKRDICFLWMSIGKGELHRQSYHSLKRFFGPLPFTFLLEEALNGGRRAIRADEVIVANWEKLRAKDKETGEWKNVLMKDRETLNFPELIHRTKQQSDIVLIIDESHAGASSDRAVELREMIGASVVVEVSATPTLIEGKHDSRLVEVSASDVIDEGMIKKEIIVNENIHQLGEDDLDSQQLVLEAAYRKREELQRAYEALRSRVHPLVLIQIPTGTEGEEKRIGIERFLGEHEVSVSNGKLAVWLSEEKVNLAILENDESDVEFLIFKQAIDTGWDCPRAQVLVKFRESKSETFELQTVGRIFRMPEAKHYSDDTLNKAFIYTNIQPGHFDFKGEDTVLRNAIKSIAVKREACYGDLRLRSYYRNRVDFGDLTFSFYNVLNAVLCEKSGIAQELPQDADGIRNNLETAKKFLKFDAIRRDALVLNRHIDAKFFDFLDQEEVQSDEDFRVRLSQTDKDRVVKNLFLKNLNGFAPARSLDIFQGAVFSWFRKYLGLGIFDGGATYIENILLNNSMFFSEAFDEATRAYKPIKHQEVLKKIADSETWKDDWEIAPERNYNPETHKPFAYQRSLYKKQDEGKTYLQFDSKAERKFVDFVEQKSDRVLWWWQNGNEHMALNFGIKYGEGLTFQPDFLVALTDGRIGIFDTKDAKHNEEDTRVKAEALQRYIAEENARRGRSMFFGGIVIEEGDHFRINSDKQYVSPHKEHPAADQVAEGKEERYEHASGRKDTAIGWVRFEL